MLSDKHIAIYRVSVAYKCDWQLANIINCNYKLCTKNYKNHTDSLGMKFIVALTLALALLGLQDVSARSVLGELGQAFVCDVCHIY